MNLKELVNKLKLEVHSGENQLDREVTGGYASDLLSNVMANGRNGQIWVTIQIHQNIIAVASLLGMAAIILPQGLVPAKNTLEKAKEEGIPILSSKLNAFQLIGELYQLGVQREEIYVHA